MPIDRLQKVPSLTRIHARRFKPDFRQFLDIDSLRNVYDRVGPFSQAQAIAVFRGGGSRPANVVCQGLAGAGGGWVLYFYSPGNLHFKRRAIERRWNGNFRMSRLIEHSLQAVAIQSHIKRVAACNHEFWRVLSLGHHRYVKAAQLRRGSRIRRRLVRLIGGHHDLIGNHLSDHLV
ncbi:MAG: hypothetical protein DMG32_11605 [Acidobacteria bacterium]|nr:MAG: hypothetical protein DMG32_11605 [Acidobacteriota bacterium]